MTVVEVRGLRKVFRPGGLQRLWRRPNTALDGVTFDLPEGEFAGLVGESGSGKTTLGRCVLGLLPFEAETVRVAGFDVRNLRHRHRRAFRRAAQMVFQNPYASLNPAFRVRTTLAEAVRIHGADGDVEGDAVGRMARLVSLPEARLEEMPSSLSGGERRRVSFARALATRPRFVVADEPVSGLDPPIQVQLLELLRRVHGRGEITFLFISHDLRSVRSLATRVLVLYRGRIVEDAPASVFFRGGELHPYSTELLDSAFCAEALLRARRPVFSPAQGGGGCPFRHRCPRAHVDHAGPCARIMPPLETARTGHRVACHRWRQS